jgi:hypothetical protein
MHHPCSSAIYSSQNSLCSDGARTRPAVVLQSFLCIERNHCRAAWAGLGLGWAYAGPLQH